MVVSGSDEIEYCILTTCKSTYEHYPNCWTYAWQDGPFTSFYCDSGTPTTPYSVFMTAPPICTDPAWQNGPDAWITSSFDASLTSWWSTASKQTVSGATAAHFAHQLSCDFGSNACNVQCGIDSGTACSNPNCDGQFPPLHLNDQR